LEFQGEFLTQSLTSREIAYNSVSVLFDSIGNWGRCHKRIGRNVILRQGGEDDRERGGCFKCARMVLRSPNVLQLHSTRALDAQCYPDEASARAACPNGSHHGGHHEVMMYKTRGFYGGSAVTRVHCPLNGDFRFAYSVEGEGGGARIECGEEQNEAGDCPTGYKFDLRFRGCSFPDFGKLEPAVEF